MRGAVGTLLNLSALMPHRSGVTRRNPGLAPAPSAVGDFVPVEDHLRDDTLFPLGLRRFLLECATRFWFKRRYAQR